MTKLSISMFICTRFEHPDWLDFFLSFIDWNEQIAFFHLISTKVFPMQCLDFNTIEIDLTVVYLVRFVAHSSCYNKEVIHLQTAGKCTQENTMCYALVAGARNSNE